ncbi:unnamed protein product, partial [Candidula unifasciata]
ANDDLSFWLSNETTVTKSSQAQEEGSTVVMNGPSQVSPPPVVSSAASRPKITVENIVLTSDEDEHEE